MADQNTKDKEKKTRPFFSVVYLQRASVASIAISNKANNFLLPSIHSAAAVADLQSQSVPSSFNPSSPPSASASALPSLLHRLLACLWFLPHKPTYSSRGSEDKKGSPSAEGVPAVSPHQCLSPWGTAPAPSTPSSSGAAGRRRRLLRVSANHHQSQANAISDSLLPPN